MATDQRNLPAYFNSDADFQTWAQGVEAQLVACGLVNTADTGQVNLATMVRPAANGFAGYRIYRFNDAMQASKPVFIKWEYGVASATNMPSWRISLGTGTNGAGTLTGTVIGTYQAAASSSKSAGIQLPSYCQGDGGGIRIVNNFDIATGGFRIYCFIERFRNPDGTPNPNGVFIFMGGQSISSNVLPFTGAAPSSNGSGSGLPTPPINNAQGALSAAGSEVAMSPFYGIWGRLYQILGIMQYWSADIGAGVAFSSSSWLGAAHTWMPFGSVGGPPGSGSSAAIAMLWE
jgi:hypothetical protein